MSDIYDLQKMQKTLKKYLDKDRYEHTLGVMYTSAALAMAYGVDCMAAQTAGLLHDCAKCIPNKKKLRLCCKYNITVTPLEEQNPFLLHAKLGALIARKKYGIDEKEILQAIVWHTTGKPGMNALEKIVYIADYIEPHRNRAPRLSAIRQLAFQDLDECIYEILKDTLAYLANMPQSIDDASKKAYMYYKKLHEERKETRHE